jgi:hypothetical protein
VANFHGDAHNHKEGRLEVKTGEEINTQKNREREGYRSTEGRLEVKTEEEINTKKKQREKVIGVLREKDQHTTKMMSLHQPGIEPGSVPWQGTILPLDHWCCCVSRGIYCILNLFSEHRRRWKRIQSL